MVGGKFCAGDWNALKLNVLTRCCKIFGCAWLQVVMVRQLKFGSWAVVVRLGFAIVSLWDSYL